METQEGLTLVVGLGLVGGSIARALTQAGWSVQGVDPDATTRAAALTAGAVRHAHADLTGLIAVPSLVVLATPPLVTLDLLAHPWPPEAIVTDCASVKVAVIEAVPERLRPRFVGGHPMAGNEGRGFSASDPELFRGRPWILSPTSETPPSATARVEHTVRALGANPVFMSARDHDRHVALLSHLPNVLAAILVDMALDLERPDIAAGSWRDATRVAGGNADLWADIFTMNANDIAEWLDQMVSRLEEVRRALEGRNREALMALFTAGDAR